MADCIKLPKSEIRMEKKSNRLTECETADRERSERAKRQRKRQIMINSPLMTEMPRKDQQQNAT